uniref:Uncharacterized protein n=1 Tax=Rousettus aegyptiacus TaxID=9407 RepID=A0A7J8CIR0_ROUAE|nr:hypothetical protein HJG63_009221 [Rousettus aegyptiacus]
MCSSIPGLRPVDISPSLQTWPNIPRGIKITPNPHPPVENHCFRQEVFSALGLGFLFAQLGSSEPPGHGRAPCSRVLLHKPVPMATADGTQRMPVQGRRPRRPGSSVSLAGGWDVYQFHLEDGGGFALCPIQWKEGGTVPVQRGHR